MQVTLEGINQLIRNNKDKFDVSEVSDGYHSFKELYYHRCKLWIVVCRLMNDMTRIGIANAAVFKTKVHSDGSAYDGWFVLGMINYQDREGGEIEEQLTYHLPMDMWDECDVDELEIAPEFDGHSSTDVLQRLDNL